MAKTPEQLSFELEKLYAAEAKVQVIRDRVENTRTETLKELHVQLGYGSTHELIDALTLVAGRRQGRPPGAGAKNGMPAAPRAGRTVLTEEIRRGVIAAVKQGKRGREIAVEFGISLPSVNNIKRTAGLSRPNKQ